MSDARWLSPSSFVRRGYRALAPLRLRRAIRSRLVTPPPDAVRPQAPTHRAFVLPLPQLADGVVRRRSSLLIEVPSRFYVTRQLHQGGVRGYEPGTAAAMLGIAEAIRPSVVFDIGANMGPHALLVPALLDVPVVAFEPAVDVAAALRHVVDTNGLRCTVREVALGATEGTSTLYISPTDTSTSLRAGFRTARGEVTVQVLTLDGVVRSGGLKPSLIKIDTETTEPDVLRGGSELLAGRPWLVCEVLPGWTEAAIEEILLPLGYLPHQIANDSPPVRREGVVGHASLEAANWLFAPCEPPADIWRAIERWREAIDACPAPDSETARSGS